MGSSARLLEGPIPPTPSAGQVTIFIDQSDKHLKQIDDSGSVTDLTATGVGASPQTVNDTTTRSTSSTGFVDLPLATITLNQGTGSYIINFFANFAPTGGANRSCDFIINVNGVDQLHTLSQEVKDGADGGSSKIFHVGSITNGQIVKIRFRISAVTLDVFNYTLSAIRL